jgi:hypothetical protein
MDERAKGSIKRQSSSSRRAAFRISHRKSSSASRRTHPLFVASGSDDELQTKIYQSPPVRSRRSVFGLFPDQTPPPVSRSPAQLGSSTSTPVHGQGSVPETLTANRSASPHDLSYSGSRRSQSPSSVGRFPSTGRPLQPKDLNVRPSSPVIYQSYNKLDKGKGVDRSGFQTNYVSPVPVDLSPVQVYTYLEPQAIMDALSALQPSSSVNLPSSGSNHSSTPDWSDKVNLVPSRLPSPTPSPVDNLQVDEEGWPIKPITRARQRLSRISEEASSSRRSPVTPTPANWMQTNDQGRSDKPITRTPRTFQESLADVSVSHWCCI